MEYQCVSARFLFFNGKETFTVEFAYGLMTWFVFKDEETSSCIFQKKVNPAKAKSPTRDEAENILCEYLVIEVF